MKRINNIFDFYDVIKKSSRVKRNIVQRLLKNDIATSSQMKFLNESLEAILDIPKKNGRYYLRTSRSGSSGISFDFSYEIDELKKDILFLKYGENALFEHLGKNSKRFDSEVNQVINFLGKDDLNIFATDRDGTINNYCGTYMSSVQSVYNSYFITKFAKLKVSFPLILTSAPLSGIINMSVNPKKSFVYAGSKGREYIAFNGTLNRQTVEKEKELCLKKVSKRILSLLNTDEYKVFSYIGSGFQIKFGQLTVARQDISGSIKKKDSLNFLDTIKKVVSEVDKDGFLEIEDTGMDIEIILKENDSAFDKGDGLKFVLESLDIDSSKGVNLVCGDTSSDIPLSKKMHSLNKKTKSIFVTTDSKLKKKILTQKIGKVLFVSSPDVLVLGLFLATNGKSDK